MKKLILSAAISAMILCSACSKHAEKEAAHEKSLPNVPVITEHDAVVKKVNSQNDPSSVYMSGLGYFADRDPQSQEPTIQDFVIANFNSHNRVQWENTDSHDLFTLIKIDNPTYDNGVIVSGDLVWGKQAFN